LQKSQVVRSVISFIDAVTSSTLTTMRDQCVLINCCRDRTIFGSHKCLPWVFPVKIYTVKVIILDLSNVPCNERLSVSFGRCSCTILDTSSPSTNTDGNLDTLVMSGSDKIRELSLCVVWVSPARGSVGIQDSKSW
jgi:hypothetical protein